MVNTRHKPVDEMRSSVEATSDGEADRPAVSRALRKLLIDANPALRGEREEKLPPSSKVYHYRGAAYEIDDDTRQEWLDSQPNRYLKRKADKISRSDNGDTPPTKRTRRQVKEDEENTPPPKRKRGRPRKYPLPIEASSSSSSRPIVRPSRTQVLCADSALQSRGADGKWIRGQSARDKARREGYKVDPIPWSAVLMNQMAKFCAVQARLRELRKEIKMACDLETRIEERNREDTVEGAQAFDDAESTGEGAANDDKHGQEPMTPDYDQSETHDEHIIRSPRSEDNENSFVSFESEREDRAEHHIFQGKLEQANSTDDRMDRMKRDLAVIKEWEVLKDGRTMEENEGRAPLPHRCPDAVETAATDYLPQRLPLYTE